MITIDELKTKIDKKARLLGIDMGTKNIGISIYLFERISSIVAHYTIWRMCNVTTRSIIHQNEPSRRSRIPLPKLN